MKPVNKDFIGKPAPPGYVAGIGRGATGFTTRSDIGPAREFPNKDGESKHKTFKAPKKNDSDDEEDFNDNNYDDFAGYKSSLFSKEPYEQEDEEADLIYSSIDKHMDERGKNNRHSKLKAKDSDISDDEKPKIQQQFSDVKQDLATISEEDWMSIPEVGDARNRKQRVPRGVKITPIPESLLAYQARQASGGEHNVYIESTSAGIDTPLYTGTSTSTLEQMGEIRSSYMSLKLNQISDNVGGQTVVNPQGYLTELKALNTLQMTDTKTIQNAEKTFKAILSSNPYNPLAWFGLARLKEKSGKVKKAKSILISGCEFCPKDVNLWIEAARMHPRQEAKAILIKAIEECPESIELWLKAADYEQDIESKRKIYAKALQTNSNSTILWQKLIELAREHEGGNDEKSGNQEVIRLLKDAVSNCPQSVDLWLAYANLQPYESAKVTLNEAREKNPGSKKIWIRAARLEELNGKTKMVSKIVKRTFAEMKSLGVVVSFEEWRKEAIECDNVGCKLTCREIVTQVLTERFLSTESSSFNAEFVNDTQLTEHCLEQIQMFIKDKAFECARSVYEFLVSLESQRKNEFVWTRYVEFERELCISSSTSNTNTNNIKDDSCNDSNTNKRQQQCKQEICDTARAQTNLDNIATIRRNNDMLMQVLKRSIDVSNCYKCVSLWLALASEHSMSGNIDEARGILIKALEANPDSEEIIIAAVKLEFKSNNFVEARRILRDACSTAKSAQLYYQWASLELECGVTNRALELINEACSEFKCNSELFLLGGQIEEECKQNDAARKRYSEGLKHSPNCCQLWLSLARLDEKMGSIPKARSIFEMSRMKNPKSIELCLEAARLEVRANKRDRAKSILASAVREFRNANIDVTQLEAELDQLEPRFKRPRLTASVSSLPKTR